MTFSLIGHVGAVVRQVEDRERDGQKTRVVVATRAYDTDPADLWDALTNATRIPRWFLPISGELRLGGRYQFEGNAGGQITGCAPPERLEVTWEFGGKVSWVTVTLAADGEDRTQLRLEHEAVPDGEFWPTYGPGAVGVGWDLAMMGLAFHLAGGVKPSQDEFLAWNASSDAKALMRACSAAWAEADVAGGEDPEQAKAAAARTAAFYTGEA
ncbi:SRPBCC family protein [Caulobacter sp. 1776]|uniref:SRPBCC family protein n=1 Tax=Caulobacter sp. 1776 TaxID=3156420 RepID=UPI003396EDE0